MKQSRRSNLQNLIVAGIVLWCLAAAAGVWWNASQPGETREMFIYSLIIPILVAAFFFGQVGGLLVALAASIISGSLIITYAGQVDTPFVQRLMFQILYFNTVALVTSSLSDRSRLQQQQLAEQVERLKALRAIDTAITSGADLKSNLYLILESLVSLLKIDSADIMLIDAGTQKLEYKAGLGFQGSDVAQSLLALDQGFAGVAVRDRRLMTYPDLSEVEDGYARQLQKEGYASYFCAPLIAKQTVQGVLEIYHRTPLDPDPAWLDFLSALAGQAAVAIDSGRLVESLHQSNYHLSQAYEETLHGWAKALELRTQESEGRTRAMAEMTLQLAGIFGIDPARRPHIYRGALLHDLGLVAIPDAILFKPGPLTEAEWQIIRQHPLYAQQILNAIEYLNPAIAIPYAHHERWNGSGYPLGLKAAAIPLEARIFAVVDVWDALSSERPYRAAWNQAKIAGYLIQQSGVLFDPQVVEAFLKLPQITQR